MKLLITLFIASIPFFASAQEIDKTKLIGTWQFQSVSKDSVNCDMPDPYPIDMLVFTEKGKFTITGSETITGKFEVKANAIRFYETSKKGVQKSTEQGIVIRQLDNTYLILVIPQLCSDSYPKYERVQ